MSTDIQHVASAKKLQLETVLPEWCALKWQHLAVCLFFSTCFLLYCYLPVTSSATWNDVSAGHITSEAESGHLLPLSEGIRSHCFGSTGKRIVASIHGYGGTGFLSLAFATFQIGLLVIWSVVFYQILPGNRAFLATAWLSIVCFWEFDGLNTQAFGQILAAFLFLILNSCYRKNTDEICWSNADPKRWLCVMLVSVAWVNLDVSFVVGLIGLAIFALARAIRLAFRLKSRSVSLGAMLRDQELQSRIWLLELAALVTLINPQGIELWKAVMWWPDNPVLHAVTRSYPTPIFSWTGTAIAIGWLTWFGLGIRTKRISILDVLLLVASTIAVAFSSKLIFWFAIAAAIAVLKLLAQQVPRSQSVANSTCVGVSRNSGQLRFVYSLLCGLCIWVVFCLSPIGNDILGGKPRKDREMLGDRFPVAIKQHLSVTRPNGLFSCPAYWSDWMQAETGLSLMTNSDVNRVPAMVAFDDAAIHRGVSDWRKIADKYALKGLVVDKLRDSNLLRSLRRQPSEWRIVAEDRHSVLYWREL